jgi:hypothetical protein
MFAPFLSLGRKGANTTGNESAEAKDRPDFALLAPQAHGELRQRKSSAFAVPLELRCGLCNLWSVAGFFSSSEKIKEMRRLIAVALIALGIAAAGSSAASAESVMKQCGDQWQAAKAAGTTNGETWSQFLSQCRAHIQAGTAAPSSASAPAPSMHTVPAPPPTQTIGESPAPAPVPAATGAGEFASEQQARARCPSDTIVWVNNISHVYHYNVVSSHGRNFYGNTKDGAYVCEADARAAGDRAAKDEQHP